MKFVLVHGRTPNRPSFSALCCESIGGATCESLQRVSPTVTISATSATARLPSRRCKSERGHRDDHRRFNRPTRSHP
jgi:hypothetical protein